VKNSVNSEEPDPSAQLLNCSTAPVFPRCIAPIPSKTDINVRTLMYIDTTAEVFLSNFSRDVTKGSYAYGHTPII